MCSLHMLIQFYGFYKTFCKQDDHHNTPRFTTCYPRTGFSPLFSPSHPAPIFFIWLPRLNDIMINSTDYRLRLVKFRSWHWYFNCCLTYGKLLHHYDWCSLGILCLVASVVSRLFATPWTVVFQAPLYMGFSRQEYWSGLPCPSSNNRRVSRLTNLFTCLELTMKIS